MMIEGAAAVPLAAYLKHRESHKEQQIAIVLCGANIGLDVLRSILETGI